MSFNCLHFAEGFDVICLEDMKDGSQACFFIERHGEDVTWQRRTLGGFDPVTGWEDVSWVDESAKALFKHLRSREMDLPAGRVTEERHRMYINDLIAHLDRVVYHGDTFEVETQPVEHYLRGNLWYVHATVVKVN